MSDQFNDRLHQGALSQLVAQFEVRYSQWLDSAGQLRCSQQDLIAYDIHKERLLEFYRAMSYTRTFDHKAISLQRTGRLGTYASCLGQEALGVAIGCSMLATDVFIPSYRESAVLLQRGAKAEEILLYWGGDERGSNYQNPSEDMPCSIPIATQCLHAVGIAYAFKLRQQARVALVVCGDGGTSKGDFYEAVNAAAVWQLPLVFVVCNNQWAISVPRSLQTATATLAQKAIAGGVANQQIDGNDVVGCYVAISEALKKARSGQGPQLIEAITYRLSDHTTADDASRYRNEQVLKEAWQHEPLLRLKRFLIAQYQVLDSDLDKLDADNEKLIEQVVENYLNTEPASNTAMFDYLYAQWPAPMADQKQQHLARFGSSDSGVES